jgi:hypothetical protein
MAGSRREIKVQPHDFKVQNAMATTEYFVAQAEMF